MNEKLVNRTRDLGLSTGHADTAEELLDEVLDQLEGKKSIDSLYDELLYSVANVFPNETRHETALRYIRNAEKSDDRCVEEKADD